MLSRAHATPMERTVTGSFGTAVSFTVYHCYAFALVTMMLWAIFYQSWLAFVWLILACVIWVAPDTRKLCFKASPVIVAYAEVSCQSANGQIYSRYSSYSASSTYSPCSWTTI